MKGTLLLVIVAALPGAAPARAAPPAKKIDPLSALAGGSQGALAGKLREALLAALPDPLFEDARKWGLKKAGPRGKVYNDGRWWKVRVTGRHLSNTLVLDLRDVQQPGGGRTTFTAYLMFDATVVLDRQTWKRGVRLYSGSTRARMRVRLTLDCEATTRLEKGKGLLPDALFRLRVTRSDLKYDNLVVEHTAGIGGDGAKLLGELMLGTLQAVKPSLQRDLLNKANAAILKAGDTKEVRVSLTELLGGKK
jgi:hypothetical protein